MPESQINKVMRIERPENRDCPIARLIRDSPGAEE